VYAQEIANTPRLNTMVMAMAVGGFPTFSAFTAVPLADQEAVHIDLSLRWLFLRGDLLCTPIRFRTTLSTVLGGPIGR
jgi:hypothetical protein